MELIAGTDNGAFVLSAIPRVGIPGAGPGVANSATLVNGGQQIVLDGSLASASATTVSGGGIERVSSGGSATGTTVDSGERLELIGGATAAAYTINSGGVLAVSAGS